MPRVHDGAANPDPEHGPASGLRFAVVVSRFNDFVTSKLLDGCIDHLEENGADTDEIDIYWVPGAFEIPLAAQKCAQTGRFDAVICLGAVILGETDHYRLVVDGATQGIARVGLDTGRTRDLRGASHADSRVSDGPSRRIGGQQRRRGSASSNRDCASVADDRVAA